MTTDYYQLHPFRKYLRLIKQLPKYDYMQAKRMAETGVPQAVLSELIGAGVHVVLNADQVQIDWLTNEIVDCRSWERICQMHEYNRVDWEFLTGMALETLEINMRRMAAGFRNWRMPEPTLIFISDQCDLRDTSAQRMLFHTLCCCRHWLVTLVWFYNPVMHSRRPEMSIDDQLRPMPRAWRNQIESVLDCQFGDLIRCSTHLHSERHVSVLPKTLRSVKPASVKTIAEVVSANAPQHV